MNEETDNLNAAIDRAVKAERLLTEAKLQGLRDLLREALEGRDKAVALLVSSQANRMLGYMAFLAVLELALRLWGK